MSSSNYQLIYQAIENKKQIHADYQNYHRQMCPHVLGHKQNKEQALFCQFGGESKTDGVITPDNAKWRCILVEELSNVKIVDGDWYTLDTTGQKRTTCVDEIDIEIPF